MSINYAISIEYTEEAVVCEGCEKERPKDRGFPEFSFEVNGTVRSLCRDCVVSEFNRVGEVLAFQIDTTL